MQARRRTHACVTALVAALAAREAGSQAAPAAAAPVDWRAQLHSWCGGNPVPDCRSVDSLDPALEGPAQARGALVVADRVMRNLASVDLDATLHTQVEAMLRGAPPVQDAASGAAAAGRLLEAFVTMLPARARPLTRSWAGDIWWQDLSRSEATPAWRRAAHDRDARTNTARDTLARAAELVNQVTTQSLPAPRALDAAAAIAASAIERGATPSNVVHAFVEMVEAMPRRPPPEPAGPPPGPTRAQVIGAMDGIRAQVEHCVGVQDGTVQLRIEFQSDGHVSDATVVGPFANTMVASCVRTVAIGVTVPPFPRESFSVVYPFVVYGAHPRPAGSAPAVVPVAEPPPPPEPPPPEPVRPAAPPPSETLPDHPSDVDVESVLLALAPSIRACAPHAHGTIALTIRVNGGGEVESATASGHFPPDTISCAEGATMNARFPRFSQPAITLTQRVQMGRGR